MLLSRTRHTARTGLVQVRLPYACARCGAQATAEVRCEGTGTATTLYGIAADVEAARARARASENANAFARAAVATAACPRCGSLQPEITARLEAFSRAAAARAKLRFPLAAAAAALAALALAVPTVDDLAHSWSLAVVSSSIVAFVGATILAIFSAPRDVPRVHRSAVSFWWPQANGTPGWVAAPEPQLPDAPASGGVYATSLAFSIASGIAAFIAIAVWVDTFTHVYVVDPGPRSHPLAIRIDGVTRDGSDGTFGDANVRKLTVRKGESHDVETTDADGRTQTFRISAKNDYGWVVAPGGFKHNLCVLETKHLYGKSAEKHASALFNQNGDAFPLPRKYDDVFTAPPTSVQGARGQTSASRWTLRAAACSGLEHKKLVPFNASLSSGDVRASR